ncbi:D630003M21Rik [Phodopus roborovskii]|uniref:D630003M21Rik protein n=1 Tax=Phodopus roborovskii TaxID=109678 RepID=A0AAU9YNF4_PHORO|nr:D630003M21Rik [Phodopus roborovskii]
MDPSALDMAIQHALAGLYPPFEATAPTVLGQVFRLLESDFRGDGLNFLLDFLIPAKRLCEQVREAACALYTHCLFLHEGWPLCLRDEVVVHLAPLNPLLLRQGDFYLQVESREEQSVHMTLKCLSSDLRKVDNKSIPETSYSLIFTPEWLEAINSDFEGRPLYNCLVASENGITPVPWTRITSPEFIDDRPLVANVPSSDGDSCPLETLHLSSPQEPYQASSLGSEGSVAHSWAKDKGKLSRDKYPGLIKVEPAKPGHTAFRMDSEANQGLEGDYVALLGFPQQCRRVSPDREVAALSMDTHRSQEERSRTKRAPLLGRVLPSPGPDDGVPMGRLASVKPAGSGEKACSGGSRRRARHKASAHTAERQLQQSHSGLQTPLDCTSGLVKDTEEDPAVSKMHRPLGTPTAMVQLRPEPRQTFSPLLSSAAPVALASETKTEETTPEHSRASKPQAFLNRNTSICGSLAPGLQFLKGQKAPLLPPEKALSPLNSLQPCGTKASGKDGTALPRTSGSAPLSGEPPGFRKDSSGPSGRGLSLEECSRPEPRIGTLGVKLLHSRIACLPGGRDRAGRPLLLMSTMQEAWDAPWCSTLEVTELLSYLCSVPRLDDKAKGLLVVIDARKGPPSPALVSALQSTRALAQASISKVLLLGEKASILQPPALPVQVEVLTSLKALRNHVDPSQLPEALEGPFPYHHSEWVQFFQKLGPFLTDLRQASSLLQASIQEFEKGDPPGGMQEATRCLGKSKDLMEAVLRDPGLLALQREGGATLARLQQEASKLKANPDVRSRLTEAAALYNLVDDQLHVLVTVSNHLLRRLELRVRLGHLEAAIHQVNDWMEQEGSQCLQALAPVDLCAEKVEKVHAEFEDFFLQVAAQYRQGLELSKQAAQLGAAEEGAGEMGLPDLVAFASTQQAFQARLTHFYMAAERQRTDLETLLHLHRFRKKMSRFHTDCQGLLTQLRQGKTSKTSPGDQLHLRLHCYLKRLASEFQTEKLLAMKLQVASLSWAGLGQELWEEAQERHQEIQGLLRTALAYCPCPEVTAAQSAHTDRSRPAAKGQGLPREVVSKWDRSLQGSLTVDHVPKSHRSPHVFQGEQSRDMWAGLPPQEAGQTVDTEEGRGAPKLPEPTLERLLTSLFSWHHLPRQSKASHPTGGSFSSEGTDSQTSLEDSPHTSPPASL